ncbi:MAG: LexA family transcriptional regulator [Bacteroidetes bacterium]|nr:LexA family transcriptional regulator [Bacteroidota bacterium]
MSWKIFFNTLLRDFRLSGNELATETGIHQPTINRIVRGITEKPYPSTIKRIEDALNIRIDDSDPENITYKKLNNEPKQIFDGAIPVYNYPLLATVYAGDPELLDHEHFDESIPFAYKKNSDKCFALSVNGKSMETTLRDGDLILVDMDLLPIDGDLVAVKLKNGNQYIKRYKNLNYAFVQLSSDNSEYGVRLVDKKDIEAIYPVVQIVFNLRNGERKSGTK